MRYHKQTARNLCFVVELLMFSGSLKGIKLSHNKAAQLGRFKALFVLRGRCAPFYAKRTAL
jgi:hypothetical protein